MNLSEKQKKFVIKSINKLTLEKIAKAVNVDIDILMEFVYSQNLSYLKNGINSSNKKVVEGKITKYYLFFFALIIFIVYINSLNSAFVSDDVSTIITYKNITNLGFILTHPNRWGSDILYFIILKVFGVNPIPFRTLNILFHLLNVWIVYFLINLFQEKKKAFLIASFFAVHPILVESISWISGGPYVRYSLFLLLALLFFIKLKAKKQYYWYSLIFFILSLFSSDKAIVTPLLFFLYEISFGKIKENWKKLTPYFSIAGVWVLFYLSQLGNRISGMEIQSYSQVKMMNPFFQIPVALSSYIQLIFWPDKLTLYHSEMAFTPLQFGFLVAITVGLFVTIIISYFKNRQIFFWLSFFVISLLPTLTPFGISWIVAERYVYLGSIGIFFVISYGFTYLIKNEKTKVIGYTLFVICLLALMTRTIVRNMDWKNEDTLWTSMIRTSPSDPKTHNNLGDMYGRQGNMQKSIEEFKRAIALNPNYADAYHNLGNAYVNTKKYELAMKSYLKAASINPNLWQSYQNIAAIYFSAKQYDKALENMNKAIKINSQEPSLYLNLAVVYLQIEDKAKAKQALLKVLEIDPGNQKAKEILMRF